MFRVNRFPHLISADKELLGQVVMMVEALPTVVSRSSHEWQDTSDNYFSQFVSPDSNRIAARPSHVAGRNPAAVNASGIPYAAYEKLGGIRLKLEDWMYAKNTLYNRVAKKEEGDAYYSGDDFARFENAQDPLAAIDRVHTLLVNTHLDCTPLRNMLKRLASARAVLVASTSAGSAIRVRWITSRGRDGECRPLFWSDDLHLNIVRPPTSPEWRGLDRVITK